MERLGRAHLFLMHCLAGIPGVLLRPGLVIRQLYMVGVLTLLIILLTARVFAELATRLQSPSVIGELFAGVLLGPSVLVQRKFASMLAGQSSGYYLC